MRAVAWDAGAWAAVQLAAGYGVHRIPLERLASDNWLTRPRRVEAGGDLYSGALRIRRWKDRLPEAGNAFAGGFDKSHLAGRSPAQLHRLAAETRRAELGHWLAVVPTPAFVAASPRIVKPFMVVYPLAVNLPCIAVQRYNRLRLARVLERQAAAGAGANGSRADSAARSRNDLGTTGSSIP